MTNTSDSHESAGSRELLERAAEADQRGDHAAAVALYQRAIDLGSLEAYSLLGFSFYERGELENAIHWWRRGVDAGDTECMLDLAAQYHERSELVLALQWWTRAADAGEPQGMVQLGRFHSRMDQIPQAVTWYGRAVDLGSSDAMEELGGLHHDRGEIDAAERLYRLAADLGNTEAMKALGVLYDRDRKDVGQAQAWFRKAIDAGDPEGYQLLGAHYNLHGRTAESVQAFRKAADAGLAVAMVALGNYHRSRREMGMAREWYIKAKAAGDPEAEELLLEISQKEETSSGCYIATAVYGSYDAREVRALRLFRDRTLARSAGGRAFIRVYYRLSPHLSTHFESGGGLSRIGKRVLDPVVRWAEAHESA